MSKSPLLPPSAALTDEPQPRRSFLQTLGTGALLAVIATPSGRAASSPARPEPTPAPNLAATIEPAYYPDPGWSG